MHVERNRLATDDAVFDFVAKQGVDRQKFIDTYRSMGISARVRKTDAMMEAYNVTFWPMIAIDGRYITSPSQANQGSKSARTKNSSMPCADRDGRAGGESQSGKEVSMSIRRSPGTRIA
jgi:hypothetical protein